MQVSAHVVSLCRQAMVIENGGVLGQVIIRYVMCRVIA